MNAYKQNQPIERMDPCFVWKGQTAGLQRRSAYRCGRTHKLEIMLRYKLQTRKWLSDMNTGLRMMSKRKLDLRPSKVSHNGNRRRFGRPGGVSPDVGAAV